ncbi:MAG: 50S ribosomal protein L13 [Bacteroidetes bacterium]|nr:50S ribosomal protein L13 [Bacteroidota bacterium]
MDNLSYKTVHANKATVKKNWILIDAENQVLGRLASQAAYVLLGKHKVDFTPHVDNGDNLVIINAGKVRLTGNKLQDKVYKRHTGYPGGQRFATPKELMAKDATLVIRKAIHGMLPKNRLGDVMRKNVFIYEGAEHDKAAQQPKQIKIDSLK